MERKRISIIGVGLIGGSLAIQLNEKGLASKLIGVDTNRDHQKKALELGLVDEMMDLDEAIENSDVVVLAIPVDAMVNMLPNVLDRITNQVLIDMGSTKSEMMTIANSHAKRSRYVATHPMWGTEYSGPQAAVQGAFENKAVIICNANESDEDALEWTKNMYRKIGMHLLEMDAVDHVVPLMVVPEQHPLVVAMYAYCASQQLLIRPPQNRTC